MMVGFMETLYNASDSLFSACQEGWICGTTMAGTLLQPNALMHQHPQLRGENERERSESVCMLNVTELCAV